MKKQIAITSICLLLNTPLAIAADSSVPYPDGYRQWTHVKTMAIQAGHPLETPFQGIHHIYANNSALKGLESSTYDDGAVLVFDLLNAIEGNNTVQEGDRKLVGVMHKDASKYKKTGGWGFEGFAANSETERLTKDGGLSCFGCHSPEKNSDYVFTKWRQ